MIVEARIDYKNRKLILIHHDGYIESVDAIPPYFYVIVEKSRKKVLEAILNTEDTVVEEDPRTPLILKGNRYVESKDHVVLRVYTSSPTEVPRLSQMLIERGFRVSASNVRYLIRNTLDHCVRFFDAIPLYYGFDSKLNEKITTPKGLVIDIEAIKGKPVLASVYIYRPFEEIRKDNVISLELPTEMDELQKLINRYTIIYGHNIIGFDIPVLERSGLIVDRTTKLLFDTTLVLSTYGSSLGVGSARSLLDVAMVLKEEVGITDEELDIKKRVKGRIDKLSKEDLVKYNANDVVLTCKILDSIAPFVFTVSAITSIPPSEVMELPSGMVAEYMLLRFCELHGFIPEYRPTNAKLTGERVYCEAEAKSYNNVLHMDIKAMYPSYVLAHYIDPTLHLGNQEFSRDIGVGPIYALVKRLYQIRLLTKKLKKQDKRFEPVDKGVKSILNALAYGVQAKSGGLALMGNPWCPAKIFYGTRDIQFNTIEFLKKHGVRVIYSDTDSFFIALNGRDPNEIIKMVNEFLAKYGLEADVEEIWDTMHIYKKKNYILKKGDKIIIKGGALLNLDRIYLPECISLYQLVKIEDKKERLKYIKEVIESADLEDLFFRGHQQIWRLFGKDLQSWKRLKDRRERYIVATTPWGEKPYIVLKKSHIGHFMTPHSAPIFSFFLDCREEIEIAELNPFNIVELRSIRLDGWFAGLRARYGDYDMLVYTDKMYLIKVFDMKYGLRVGNELRYYPTQYSITSSRGFRPLFERFKCIVKTRAVKVDDRILRRMVFEHVKHTLRRYGFL